MTNGSDQMTTVRRTDGGIDLCHPNGLPGEPVTRPDCYRRVTVYHEPLGALTGVECKPAGIEKTETPETRDEKGGPGA
jgi:hypothetical protein